MRVSNSGQRDQRTRPRFAVAARTAAAGAGAACDQHGAGRSAVCGRRRDLRVAASGSGPLGFQWRRNGSDIAGANAAVLHLPSVSALDAGAYAVEVRNAAGAGDQPFGLAGW